jgi:hypothetical protein
LIDTALAVSTAPRRWSSRHPDYPYLVAEDVRVVKQAGGKSSVTTLYVGAYITYDNQGAPDIAIIPPAADDDGVDESIEVGMTDINIQNHPDFDDFVSQAIAIGDTPFDANGEFRGFGSRAPSGLRGVSSYPVPQIVVTTKWTSSVRLIGEVPARTTWNGMQALQVGFSSVRRGGVYTNTMKVSVGAQFSNILYP